MTCDFRDTSNALSMQMRGKFMEKDLLAFSLSSAKRVQFQQAEMEAEEGGGPSRQRTPEPRLGGRKFRVCSMQNECPDSGSF